MKNDVLSGETKSCEICGWNTKTRFCATCHIIWQYCQTERGLSATKKILSINNGIRKRLNKEIKNG